MASFKDEGTYTPKEFVIGETKARKVTIKAGAGLLAEATVLGQVTATKKYLTSLSAASDGSQVPDAILSEAVDASGAEDVDAVVYIAGVFDQDKLVLGTGHTLGSVDGPLRDKNITLVKPMG